MTDVANDCKVVTEYAKDRKCHWDIMNAWMQLDIVVSPRKQSPQKFFFSFKNRRIAKTSNVAT